MRKLMLQITACLLPLPALAGDVTIEKVHICCPSCVKAIEGALSKADGVTDLKVDKDAGQVTFAATDQKSANQAFRRLAREGFAGTGTHDGKQLRLPKINVEEGTKADSVVLTGVHLCCGGCVKAASGAVGKVAGVSNVTGDEEASSLTITGSDIDIQAAITALRAAGFNGALKTDEAAKPKKKAKVN